MPPQAAATQTRERSNRTTISLSDESVKRLDSLIAQAGRKTRETLGYSVTPSRSQVVESLVKDAHDRPNGDQG